MSIYDKREFFKTYFANASEKSLLVDLMRPRFNPSSDEMNILDLGCHDGSLIKKIIDAHTHHLPAKVSITGVEPSFDALSEYPKHPFPISVQVNTFAGTAEDYFLKHPGDGGFDWVIASQCLYWSFDLPFILGKIAEAGESGLIVLRGQRGIYEIQSNFRDYIGNPEEQFYTADDIESALLHLNIPFEKEVKSTFIMLPEPGSIEMQWLIAFILQQAQVNTAIRQEVESWILAKSSEKITHDVCFFWLGNSISITSKSDAEFT
ncbi:class I SAM-dependent methyltransferase [Legionella sp. 16cNR16C]|uniref:class I SAM-dependent methyltransferase n=1 Tax=Legionella sp. 16cNR16C TaxID=2905656 RepID=UPI001E588641|nr:class I SAM-dependent methyltransferase [Legionella sp. 16cNR16C]MCE3045621.1 class I SAM-dependent methyltransferase [Legionella sp. 16cNR16C]